MNRIAPKDMGLKIAKLLRKQHPDPNYLKKVFEHVRNELDMRGQTIRNKRLPDLLSSDEIERYFDGVWNTANRTHMVMLKLLFYTGIRNAELSNLEIEDVDLKQLRIHIREGKGKKDRYIPIPTGFRGELTHYIDKQVDLGSRYLFETNRKDKFSTRWIRKIVKEYAIKTGIKKRVYPHLLRHQLLTYLTKKGIHDAKIQLISGHEDRRSLAIYQTMSLVDVEEEYHDAMSELKIK